jgi:outer membrane protein
MRKRWLAHLLLGIAIIGSSWVATAQPTTAAPTPIIQSLESLNELLDNAQRLLNNKLPGEAFARLNKHLDRFAGEPKFDYLLGISALDSGHPGQAVFALERAVASDPNNAPARAELARALFALRELDAAKREFNDVKTSNPPNAVSVSIDRYLDAIKGLSEQQRAAQQQSSLTFTADLALGFDSNINSGSAQSEWLLADGARLIPTNGSLGQSAWSARLASGFEYQTKVNADMTAFAQAGFNARKAFVGSNLSFVTLDTAAGVAYTRQSGVWTVAINAGHAQVNQTSLRNVIGTSVQWQRSISKTEKAGLFIQMFDLRFPNSSTQNAQRVVLGATAARETDNGMVFVGAVSINSERSKTNSAEFSFTAPNVRVLAEWPLSNQWRAFASATIEQRKYQGVQELFSGLKRRDTEIDLKLSGEKQISNALTLVPSIGYTHNASTLGPNDYRRTQIGLSFKYRH